jgi:heptosyltransferase II
MPIDKILIRCPNWVGDSVLAIPAMKAMRAQFPNTEITLLARPWVAGLFTSAPFIDQVWSEPKTSGLGGWSRITREIRRRQFDLAVLLPNSFESALAIYLGGVPPRVGYAPAGRRCLLTTALRPGNTMRHQVHYYLDLVKTLSVAVDRPSIDLTATADEKKTARKLLAAEGIPESAPFLVLNPGAAYGSAKRWSDDRFAEVGKRLAQEFHLGIAIVGSESERPIAESIQKKMNLPVAVITGKTTLETLIGVLSESSLTITNDSGPMHIAAALGKPTIAIFGPTDEHVTGPFGRQARIVKHPVECSPCLLRECPIDHRCMENVAVDDVYRAAMDLLQHA